MCFCFVASFEVHGVVLGGVLLFWGLFRGKCRTLLLMSVMSAIFDKFHVVRELIWAVAIEDG